jgi:ornithine--oxo-acid transaminase
MLCIKPGEHGSTFGGYPLGMAVAKVAIQTIVEEGMVENSLKMGQVLSDEIRTHVKSRLLKEERGRGLFRAVEVVKDARVDGDDLQTELMKVGLLSKSTHTYFCRLTPALTITEKQVQVAAKKIKKAFSNLEKISKERKGETKGEARGIK